MPGWRKTLRHCVVGFLQGLEKVTPSWRTVQQWEFGPPPVPAELDERMAALNKSRCAVEDLMKQVQGWEEIGSRLRSRKPGKQTERRSLLAKYVGLQMMAVGIKLTKFAKVKTPPGRTRHHAGRRVYHDATGCLRGQR